MAVLSGFPIITTEDLGALEAFYVAAFDAERTYAFTDEDGVEHYVTLKVGGATLGIGLEPGAPRATARAALWFYVEDVDASFRRAVAAGASSVREPTAMPWGERVAQVRDPDGLEINLGEESR